MRVLLDSQVALWGLRETRRIHEQLEEHVGANAEFWVSAVSVWELGVKAALGKLELPANLRDRLTAQGLRELTVSWRHGAEAGALPRHHNDPFDRMLVAQARVEGLSLATTDIALRAYGVPMIALRR